jgi:molybdopterin-guanine dinucleotide biosynthesis protein B
MTMRVFGFAGWSGSGKTTLIEQVIPRLAAHGLTVALIKHAHHYFDVDHPGKDSWRHRRAGCQEVLITSSARWALMHELRGAPEPSLAQSLARLSACDLALIEGFKAAPIPKIEIWRPALGKPPLHPGDPTIFAVATDEPERLDPEAAARLRVLALEAYDAIATLVLERAIPRASLLDDDRQTRVP